MGTLMLNEIKFGMNRDMTLSRVYPEIFLKKD
jgi:hypothetical protein